MLNSKVSQSVSKSVTRSLIELSWTAKNVWLVDLPVPESSSGLDLLLPWAVFCVLYFAMFRFYVAPISGIVVPVLVFHHQG